MITAPGQCGCCGAPATHRLGHAYRCAAHLTRNPCAVEGCKRTREAPLEDNQRFLADDQTICAVHWRAYVPPRSRIRKAYHAHFRRAKRLGWSMKRSRAFWRFWDTLVRIVRARATSGRIDEAEINRLMGWD